MIGLCIFCFKFADDPAPWVAGNPGHGCTYGLGHEYPKTEKPTQPARKVDRQLCTKCGLHPKNPASSTNGCAHEYL